MLFLSVPYILPNIWKMVSETAAINKSVCFGAAVQVWCGNLTWRLIALCSAPMSIGVNQSGFFFCFFFWGSEQTAIHLHTTLLQSTMFAGSEGLELQKCPAVAENSVSH